MHGLPDRLKPCTTRGTFALGYAEITVTLARQPGHQHRPPLITPQ